MAPLWSAKYAATLAVEASLAGGAPGRNVPTTLSTTNASPATAAGRAHPDSLGVGCVTAARRGVPIRGDVVVVIGLPFCSRTPRRRDRPARGALRCRRSRRRRASGGPVCSPNMVPIPAPPCASDTVMQCSVLTEYRIGAIGLPMLSSRLSAACGSFMTKQPPSPSAAWMRSSTPAGSTWSWIASNTNTTSNGCVDLEAGRVTDLEAHVGEPGAAGLGPGPRDRAVVEVVADERRRGETPAPAARARARCRTQRRRRVRPRRAARRARARAEGTRRRSNAS